MPPAASVQMMYEKEEDGLLEKLDCKGVDLSATAEEDFGMQK